MYACLALSGDLAWRAPTRSLHGWDGGRREGLGEFWDRSKGQTNRGRHAEPLHKTG
jgi:hypothetical protein